MCWRIETTLISTLLTRLHFRFVLPMNERSWLVVDCYFVLLLYFSLHIVWWCLSLMCTVYTSQIQYSIEWTRWLDELIQFWHSFIIFWLYVIVATDNKSGARQQEVYTVHDPLNGIKTKKSYSAKINDPHEWFDHVAGKGREKQETLYIDRSNVDDGHINNRLKFTYEMLRSWCTLYTTCYPVICGECVRFCALSYHRFFVYLLYIFPIYKYTYIMYMHILTFRNGLGLGLWLGLISCWIIDRTYSTDR